VTSIAPALVTTRRGRAWAVANHQGAAVFVSCLAVLFQMRRDLGLQGHREHPLRTGSADLIQRESELLASLVLEGYPEHRRTSFRRRHHAGMSDQRSKGGYAASIFRSRIHNFCSYLQRTLGSTPPG